MFDSTLLPRALTILLATLALATLPTASALADPCGMVPPIYQGQGPPIVRIGHQQTYVFFKDGVETFAIRPGFSGKTDEFGMLIPFPTPPAIRKLPDDIFPHVAAAVDPPEVVIDLRPQIVDALKSLQAAPASGNKNLRYEGRKREGVRVLRKEAVGMYEVAVLEAGSAAALQKWMDKHGYRYPDGMDDVCSEYIDAEWCFVAVKTKVGQKDGVEPKPGQRRVQPGLPAGSTFDGHVQAMGFRFKSDKLVVPMRLSAFNDGELRNIVYLLTDGPRRIRSIPEEYVVRQIDGERLVGNVTSPLPLRILGGTERDLQDWHRQGLAQRRDPAPHNGAARVMFASDALAVSADQLSLPHEEQEKELLAIGEFFGLRGPQIDKVNTAALTEQRDRTLFGAIADVKDMTLTVVDGDFPREVLASQNLTFASFRMPSRRNNPRAYDTKLKGPGAAKQGMLKLGQLPPASPGQNQVKTTRPVGWLTLAFSLAVIGILTLSRRYAK